MSSHDLISFVNYLPENNTSRRIAIKSQDRTKLTEWHILSLNKLLACDFQSFLKNIVDNNSFNQFIESYLTNRSRPLLPANSDNSQSDCVQIDKLVTLVFYRLTSPYDEHRLLHKEFSIEKQDAHYTEYLENRVKILNSSFVLSLISILSESNLSLSRDIFLRLIHWKPSLSSEIMTLFVETQKKLKEFVQTMFQLHSQTVESANLFKTKGKSLSKAQTSHVQVHFTQFNALISLLSEITYTIGLFFQIPSQDWYVSSPIFSAEGRLLSRDHGLCVYEILLLIYDILLPMSFQIRSNLGLFENSFDYDTIDKNISQCRFWALRGACQLIDVSLIAFRFPLQTIPIGGMSWFEIFSHQIDLSRLIFGRSNLNDSIFRMGGLVSDLLLSKYRPIIVNLLQYQSNEQDDDGNLDYYLSSWHLENDPWPTLKQSDNQKQEIAENSPPIGDLPLEETTQSGESDLHHKNDQLAMILSIFPDLGSAFLEACWIYYRQHTEEIIDALVSENLPPILAQLDRTRNLPDPNAKSEEILKKETEEQAFRELNKQIIKNIEKNQIHDAYIIDKEYDDDYDDQYDEYIGKKPTDLDMDNEISIVSHASIPAKSDSTNNWKVQMEETRRYNSLLRQEEQDIKFWTEMKNTNVRGSSVPEWKKSLEAEELEELENKGESDQPSRALNWNKMRNDIPESQESKRANTNQKPSLESKSKNPQKNNNSQQKEKSERENKPKEPKVKKEGEEGNQNDNSKNHKFRTKTFDRHHQRDKALKKLGSFV